jgi:Collagen triple helix repeat (20 copies)
VIRGPLLALFFAMGGTSYAAITLPRNSVGTAQIKARAVTLAKINSRAVRSLQGATGPQGPRGLKGDAGATGSTGPQGLKGDTGAPGGPGARGPAGVVGTITVHRQRHQPRDEPPGPRQRNQSDRVVRDHPERQRLGPDLHRLRRVRGDFLTSKCGTA